MENDFLTIKNEEKYKFKKVKIEWYDNDIKILFLHEGYVTETFFILHCFKLSNIIKINSVFIIKKSEKSEIKELISSKIIDMGYRDFLSWITDIGSKNSIINSEDFEESSIIGIELRIKEKSQYKWEPRERGCEKIINLISTWTIT